jgi:hypothetical protein
LPDEVIILNSASDISEFLTKLKQPDLILTRPGPSRTAASPPISQVTPGWSRAHFVSTVKIHGQVDDDLASLGLELELGLLVAGPVWVPLGIDCPILSSAREGDRELELRRTAQATWEVRIAGNGPHRLHCEVKLPVKVTPDRKRLELAIPEAPSTYVELDIPHQVFDVDLGSGETVGKLPLAGGKGTRLSAHVSPRSRLTLDWTDEGSTTASATPFLSAKVELEIDADAESVTTQSSWEIRCIRGVARALEIRLDEPDIVQTLKLDEQYLVERIERNVLTIPLSEPLRAKGIRHLTMHTRRALPSTAPRRFEFTGFSLANAVEHSGAIGITPSPNLWVKVDSARGLRRIDPGELPKDLRGRPGITLAFQFLDQPFRLGLEIEDSPPLFRTETSSTVSFDGDLARTETTINVQRVRGRLFDFEVETPPGLQLTAVEPVDLVETVIPASLAARGTKDGVSLPSGQVLRLQLTAAAREQRSLSLKLAGQQRIGHDGEVSLGLFAPRGGVTLGHTVTLSAGRDVSFEFLAESGAAGTQAAAAGAFRVQPLPDRPATGRAIDRLPIAVLKSQQNPTMVRGRLVRHPRTLSSESTVNAQVSPLGIEVNQETMIRVQHGSTSNLTVRVPLAKTEPWQVLRGKEGVRRQELGGDPGEGSRYRLYFDPPVTDSTSLAFRFRLPLGPVTSPGTEVKSAVPWIVMEEGVQGPLLVQVATSPELRTSVESSAWARLPDDRETLTGSDVPQRFRLIEPAKEPRPAKLPFTTRGLDRVPLPPVVVPRALLRSVLGVDHLARTRAWYWVESHPSELSLRLPVGARWVRARIDGRAADQLETGPTGAGYRMFLPAESHSKPVLVELEYQSPWATSRLSLDAPELDGGAVVLQTLWEVQIPWSEAVLGVPPGWADENEWYWDSFIWKRRPWRSFSRLLGWVSGASPTPPILDEVLGEEQVDSHAYLFGSSAGPGTLRLAVASRAWIVALCSGVVLFCGFLLMFSRVRFRVVWIVASVLGLAVAVFAHPSVVLLIIQSSLFGVVLTLVGLVIQRLIERTRLVASPGSPAVTGATPPSGLAAVPGGSAGVGSDDSTAIRVRVSSSTLDHVAGPLVLSPPEPEPAGSSSRGPAH